MEAVDVNGDGWTDIVCYHGAWSARRGLVGELLCGAGGRSYHKPMYVSNDGGRLVRGASAGLCPEPPGTPLPTYGLAFIADLDGDGRPDLLSTFSHVGGAGGWGNPTGVVRRVETALQIVGVSPGRDRRLSETRYWARRLVDGGTPVVIVQTEVGALLVDGQGRTFTLPGRPSVLDDCDGGSTLVMVCADDSQAEAVREAAPGKWRIDTLVDSAARGGSSMPAAWHDEYEWADFDGDGTKELIVFAVRADAHPSGAPVAHWRILTGAGRDASELARGSHALTHWHGHEYRRHSGWFQVVDLDADGRADVLAPDGRIWFAAGAVDFEAPWAHPDLPSAQARSFAVVCDVNNDGAPDLVSNVDPWKNIVFGPLQNKGP